MRILSVLTYYRPHTSGLTIYAERLARAFARRGHQVTVMTTRYDKTLAREEMMDGVRVIRVPVMMRISKGVISPTFVLEAVKQIRRNDVLQLHLPQFEAPGVALLARLLGKPVVLTYHCDLHLPPGIFNRLVNLVVKVQNNLAALLANHLVTYTQDYADHSSYLSRYRRKLTPFLPPVELPPADQNLVDAFAGKYKTRLKRPVIGMVTRFAAEKGVEILLEALPDVLKEFPAAQVLFAGQYQNVIGEKEYANRLFQRIQDFEEMGAWKFLGNLSQQELAAFYPNMTMLVVPSLNATEAFGLVQVEAMMNGIPCVASDLPGVRRPVLMHAMGKVVPVGKPAALAEAILELTAAKEKYSCDQAALARLYAPEAVAVEYEQLFMKLLKKQ
jgi:glycosyltransferase involved in cell wall biosynthesis